ncbi:hypothetical protein [Winogradskyella aquimaris]|uniref:GLPGLI family protein n=1 Tax=Winogradskyella aquimaris TaxID=864074 RepID=A0ABU5EU56_9FLAO|nr:hypothetical protein [Winogradskyella aquimaris]MDY2588344.1 hypothetical protein [Winogradskyella aquimaris]
MSKSTVYIFFFFLVCNTIFAQNEYLFVLRWKGQPYLVEKDSTIQITRGAAINKKTKLVMGRNDEIILINGDGNAIKLYETGTFKFKELVSLPPLENNSSYSRKLMNYFIKEFTYSLNNDKVKSGVVYRGDYVELIQPLDSTKFYQDEITFNWTAIENKTKPYYFIIREAGSTEATMIGCYSNKISLLVDGVNLKVGQSYQWTVVESKYENLEKINYKTFTLLDDSSYQNIKKEVDYLSEFLGSIGFSENEIESILCNEYKTCF